jgi:hypothetical protein
MNPYGKISFKPGTETSKLIVQMGSKNRAEAEAAQEAFAAFIGPVIQQVVEQAPVISNLFTDEKYNAGTVPSYPLDDYYDVRQDGFIKAWVGGLTPGNATSTIVGGDEMILDARKINTAVSMQKKYAREGRIDHVGKAMTRLAQEILWIQNNNSADLLLRAVATAQYAGAGSVTRNTQNVIRATTAGRLQMDDFNRLYTLAARTKPSNFGGTPVGGTQGLTNLLLSVEAMESIRTMSYNPQNVIAVPDTTESTVLAAPDSVRQAVWNFAGIPSLFGVQLTPLWELGSDRVYNILFAKYAGSTSYGGSSFTQASQEILVGLNLGGTNPLVRLTEQNGVGGTITLSPEEYKIKDDMLGYWGELKEGRTIVDDRGIVGLIK